VSARWSRISFYWSVSSS